MSENNGRVYVMERVFDAPRELVFEAYTTAEQLQQVLEMGMEQGFTETLDRLEAYLEEISY